MVDRYTKAVLTVIAVALSAIAFKSAFPPADAQSSCGSPAVPCYVQVIQNGPLLVTTDFAVSPRR
jgi:hypothetical protein